MEMACQEPQFNKVTISRGGFRPLETEVRKPSLPRGVV